MFPRPANAPGGGAGGGGVALRRLLGWRRAPLTTAPGGGRISLLSLFPAGVKPRAARSSG